jgi:hypothetical protein
MGYDKLDDLAINSIRLLAVSPLAASLEPFTAESWFVDLIAWPMPLLLVGRAIVDTLGEKNTRRDCGCDLVIWLR